MIQKILETLNNRFTSANSVPVERSTIKADEWEQIRKRLEEAAQEKLLLEAAQHRIAELEQSAPRWHDGEPPKVYRSEWFIAETIHGDRVVLTELPEENSYDYTTKDGTYMKAWLIKRWMPFHDSEFIPPEETFDEPDLQQAAEEVAAS